MYKFLFLLFAFFPYQGEAKNSISIEDIRKWQGNYPACSFLWSYELSVIADIAPQQSLLNLMTAFERNTGLIVHEYPYTALQKNNLVWLHPTMVSEFVRFILPTLEYPIFLLINNSDHPLSSLHAKALLDHEKIAHIFAQNCDCTGPKVSPIPLGVDYHTDRRVTPQKQETLLLETLSHLRPTHQRIKKAFVDFQHRDTSGKRKELFEQLLPTGLIEYTSHPIKRYELWKKKGDYAFSISPHGNGLDCHRTWEDLILGCIVIVKTSPLDSLYTGLPVVIVGDWGEITEENMTLWLERYGDAFTNPSYREKLTNMYWISKMKAIMEAP